MLNMLKKFKILRENMKKLWSRPNSISIKNVTSFKLNILTSSTSPKNILKILLLNSVKRKNNIKDKYNNK